MRVSRMLILYVVLLCNSARAAEELQVLPAASDPPARQMLKLRLLAEATEYFNARRRAISNINTVESVTARQRDLRGKFRAALGDWPEQTPLNATVVGRVPRDGFTIEKVIYESRPRHHVTANFYLPTGKGPFPAVLMPIGHSGNGKAADYIQRGAVLLARHGIAVLTYDPIGQGERRQLLDAQGGAAIPSITNEHTLAGVGALLVGRNTASYRIWDAIRGVDYLASRPEIDGMRLGCTGCSGGGTLTSYLMALDDRILVAAPSCYITSLERLFATIGPQDAEQNIPGQVAFGMEHGDYLLMHAPRPTLICAAKQDFFDITGTRATFREAERWFDLAGKRDQLELFETDTKHGFPRPQREAVARWMVRWLLDRDETVAEEDFALVPEAELRCTQSGQVLTEFKGVSVFDLSAQRADDLARQRARRQHTRDDVISEMRRLLALQPQQQGAERHDHGKVAREGYDITRLAFATERGILVPGLLFTPGKSASRTLAIYLDPRGMSAAAAPGGPIEARVQAGQRVLALDLRGWGETAAKPWSSNVKSPFGDLYTETFLALHLQRPLLGQRVGDLLAVLQAMNKDAPAGIELVGVGPAGLVALHAAVCAPSIKSIKLEATLASWTEVTQQPMNFGQLEHVVPGALAVYDLPELAALLAPRALTVRQPVDPQGEPLSAAVAQKLYAPVRFAYDQAQPNAGFVLELANESVLEAGSRPTLIAKEGAGEGPAWHPELGLLTSGNGHIYRRDRDGRQSIYRQGAGSNGLLFDREGRLVICQAELRRVSRVERDGKLVVLAERYEGKRFNQPNDLAIDTRGRIYFSDPCYGDRSQMEMEDAEGRKIEGVYRIDPDGQVSRILMHEVDRPNGLVVTADDRHLYVADNNNSQGGARKLWRFDLSQEGTLNLKSQALIHDWGKTRGPDGMKLDASGRLFVAGGLNQPNPPHETQEQPTAGVYVFSPTGKLLEFLPIGRDETTNCAFGGDDLKTLFVTAGGTLWSMRVTTPGKPAWPAAK